ncbi:MAG TPA: OmpA family protein [Kofleriaceae bacterium]|jgi:hypothetical protein
MKKRIAGFLFAALAGACAPKHSSFVKVGDVALGRVVVYRNGVAFYERRATVTGGQLTVSVPRDRVDDFLKSLTVVDAITKQPLPVSIPRTQANDGTYLTMKLQMPSEKPADVVLTYVTEAPAWKPSYRVVVGNDGKVMLEGWAIVDNTSGEDWKGVLVGVGSSSALSFRYDLWSVRQVHRDTLLDEEKFAIAPPTGISPYGGNKAETEQELASLGDDEIRRPAGHPEDVRATRLAEAPMSGVTATSEELDVVAGYQVDGEVSRGGGGLGSPSSASGLAMKSGKHHVTAHAMKKSMPTPATTAAALPPPPPSDTRVAGGDAKMANLSKELIHSDKTILIEGHANASAPDAERRAQDRANIVRNSLIDQGVAPARIKVVTKVAAGEAERVRLVAEALTPEEQAAKKAGVKAALDTDADPVGEANFENPRPMSVDRGSSAMVSMVHKETEGEVVYLYDAESERGNDRFAFRAVRFKNPTDSTLETGPVTVFGSKRFIGEGLTEPIPPKSSGIVPFALDRQIVVEHDSSEDDKIAKLVTLQRGVLTAQVQHIKTEKMTLTNRLPVPAKVFLKKTMAKGWTILEAPTRFERIGDAHLFEVDLAPGEVKAVAISQATPVERTLDLNADVTLGMMGIWLDAPGGSAELKDQVRKLLGVHKQLADLAQEQDSLRQRLADYRGRMDDLHNQIFTLTAVKTGGDLMTHLKSKMKDISDLVQKTTIQIVDNEEKILLTRVKFQDALSEMVLPDATVAAK